MFVVGGVAGLLLLPLMWAKLPESEAYRRATAARDVDPALPEVRTRDVVRGRYLAVSIGLWVASFMGLLLVYASTPGCRRSWAKPAPPSGPAPVCCSR